MTRIMRFASLAAVVVTGAAAAGASSASAAYFSNTCQNRASAQVCWLDANNPKYAYSVEVQTQYTRDQVCAKARDNSTSGPITPGSSCASGSSGFAVTLGASSTPRYPYAYWAGNGNPIWVLSGAWTIE